MTQTAATVSQTDSIWNKVTFTGNLGRDPEMNFTPNGNAVTKFSIAVSQGKDKFAMWLDVEAWKQLAEQCNAKLTKGMRVEIDGRLAQESWEDKDSGKKRYRYKVVAQGVRLLKKSEGKASSGGFTDESGTSATTQDDTDALGDLDDHPF
jgi:single-strand DNA-binding protein